MLLVLFDVVLLPCIPTSRRQQIAKLFNILLEIQWIAYSEPWVQKINGIRLRLEWIEVLFTIQASYIMSKIWVESISIVWILHWRRIVVYS